MNTELQKKIEELSRVNNDLNNLLTGTGIGPIFLDYHLRIQRFTPVVTEIINLIQADVGRPINHIVSNLVGYENVVEDVAAVLDTLVPKDSEVPAGKDGRTYQMKRRRLRRPPRATGRCNAQATEDDDATGDDEATTTEETGGDDDDTAAVTLVRSGNPLEESDDESQAGMTGPEDAARREAPQGGASDLRRGLLEEASPLRVQDLKALTETDIMALMHELQVHQVELEIQNEELRRAQLEHQQATERFISLYDFAPVGYLTLDRGPGFITEANATLTRQLGIDRQSLLSAPLARFVASEDQNEFHLFRRRLLRTSDLESCEVRLRGLGGAKVGPTSRGGAGRVLRTTACGGLRSAT